MALEELNQQSRAEPVRHIQTSGIVIMLGAPAQRALPAETLRLRQLSQFALDNVGPDSLGCRGMGQEVGAALSATRVAPILQRRL